MDDSSLRAAAKALSLSLMLITLSAFEAGVSGEGQQGRISPTNGRAVAPSNTDLIRIQHRGLVHQPLHAPHASVDLRVDRQG